MVAKRTCALCLGVSSESTAKCKRDAAVGCVPTLAMRAGKSLYTKHLADHSSESLIVVHHTECRCVANAQQPLLAVLLTSQSAGGPTNLSAGVHRLPPERCGPVTTEWSKTATKRGLTEESSNFANA